MNWLGFTRLIAQLYGPGLPDVGWIERQGLFAVKLGQIHALRVDFLSPEKCERLQRLFRHTDSVPPSEVERLLSTRLTREQRASLLDVEPLPLASASVGQVHRARLEDGSDVVVKIVKRDVRDQFKQDVRSVRRLLRFALWVYPTLRRVGDPEGILDDVEAYTLSELDLRNELEGQQTLRRIHDETCERFGLSKLRFARVYEELSNADIMVSELVPGRTFDELLARGRLAYEKLLDLFHIHMSYVFGTGVFHGDIHPGNIILHDDHVYFVDTGYLGRVGEKIRTGLFHFMTCLAHYDFEGCAHHLHAMSEREIAGAGLRSFREKFADLYADFADTTVSEVSLTTKMMQTIKLGVRSGMVFDRGIFPVIRSLMYLDGMVLRCRPDAVLMRDMRPFLQAGRAFGLGQGDTGHPHREDAATHNRGLPAGATS